VGSLHALVGGVPALRTLILVVATEVQCGFWHIDCVVGYLPHIFLQCTVPWRGADSRIRQSQWALSFHWSVDPALPPPPPLARRGFPAALLGAPGSRPLLAAGFLAVSRLVRPAPLLLLPPLAVVCAAVRLARLSLARLRPCPRPCRVWGGCCGLGSVPRALFHFVAQSLRRGDLFLQ
jgi:hypothetical protein